MSYYATSGTSGDTFSSSYVTYGGGGGLRASCDGEGIASYDGSGFTSPYHADYSTSWTSANSNGRRSYNYEYNSPLKYSYDEPIQATYYQDALDSMCRDEIRGGRGHVDININDIGLNCDSISSFLDELRRNCRPKNEYEVELI